MSCVSRSLRARQRVTKPYWNTTMSPPALMPAICELLVVDVQDVAEADVVLLGEHAVDDDLACW